MKWYERVDDVNRKMSEIISNKMCGKANQILCYGLNVLINGIEKAVILIMLFGLIGYIDIFITASIIMCVLRIWMGGTHRKTQIGCLVQSVIEFGVIIEIQKSVHINKTELIIGMIITIVVALVFCPIIDERRGIYSKRKINKFRKKSIVCIIGVNLIAILSLNYRNIVVACEIVEVSDVLIAHTMKKKRLKINYERDNC